MRVGESEIDFLNVLDSWYQYESVSVIYISFYKNQIFFVEARCSENFRRHEA